MLPILRHSWPGERDNSVIRGLDSRLLDPEFKAWSCQDAVLD